MAMTRLLEEIVQLVDHPDADTLRPFDHPFRSLKRWIGVLTAKAWMGTDLACFFTEAERGMERYVLIFKAANGYIAGIDGGDMRHAQVGSAYEMDVFVTAHFRPIIDRIESVRLFT